MAITPPEEHWWKPLGKDESQWLKISIVVGLFLFLMMPIYHLAGKQNPPHTTYRVSAPQYMELYSNFVDANRKKDANGEDVSLNGIPVVAPKEGVKDVFVVAAKWTFMPVLELKKGQEYRVHLSSLDLQHGFSLQPKNINFQIVPGYDQVITLTPKESGEFHLVCNEYCEIGHHTMIGKLLVTE